MNDKEQEYLSNKDNESVNGQNTLTFPLFWITQSFSV